MNKTEFLGKEIVFGTYFLGEYTEISGKSFQEGLKDIERNPFKFIPIFLQTAINTTAELNGNTEGLVTLQEVLTEVDRIGIASKEVTTVLECFTKSLMVNQDDSKKKARNKVRPVKK